MTFPLQRLRSMSDEELIALHDQTAVNTVFGVDYFLDELRRREQVRGAESSERLTRAALRLARANTVLAVVALIVSVLALLLR